MLKLREEAKLLENCQIVLIKLSTVIICNLSFICVLSKFGQFSTFSFQYKDVLVSS